MRNATLLPLDSPLWSRLETFGIPPERLPFILKRLTEDPVNPTDPALDELASAIFHQYSLTNATYAVFPYLTVIHDRYAKTNSGLFYLAANIAASANADPTHVPSEFQEAYLKTLIDLERIAISRVVAKPQPFDDIYSACIAAIAFSRHCCGRLIMDGLESEGTQHTGLICPQCDEQVEVMMFAEGLVVMQQGRKPRPPEPPSPSARPVIRIYDGRQPNPWEAVHSFLLQEAQPVGLSDTERLHVQVAIRICAVGLGPKIPPEDPFSLLGAILLRHGYVNIARRFFHLWDPVTCPRCGSTFVAAKRWWGCTECGPSAEILQSEG
jgi:hypothetical protein